MAETTGDFHQRMVELSGNATLAIVAGMLHEITVRHIAFAMRENRPMSRSDYDILMKSYRRLMTLMRSGNAAAARKRTGASTSTSRTVCCSPAWRTSRSATSCASHAVHGDIVGPRLAGHHVAHLDVAALEELAGGGVDQAVLLRLLMDGLGIEHDDPHLARLEVARSCSAATSCSFDMWPSPKFQPMAVETMRSPSVRV